MKKEDVTIGGTYSAKVGSRTLDVRIDSENAKGGWNTTAVESGKPVRIKDARNVRAAAGADGERTVELEGDVGGEAEATDGDGGAPTASGKGNKRGGKKTKGKGRTAKVKTPKAPKEKKPGKEKKPKAMSALDAAAAVLKAQGEPMRCKEMVAAMKEKGLWESKAPTPEATLYSAILREITTKKSDARFKKTDRGHFGLNTK